jgi:hypothetical protein
VLSAERDDAVQRVRLAPLERPDSRRLAGRADVGPDVVDPDLPGDGRRGGRVVAGQQHGVQAHLVQGGDGGGRVGLDRVAEQDQPGQRERAVADRSRQAT